MKKIVKPHKARKPSASADVPSFARGKDQILKSPASLQRRKKNEMGEFDTGKDEPWYDKLNNSSLGTTIKLLDPTGISSYYDVYQAKNEMYNNPSWANMGAFGLEVLGALPLIGKLGKAFKLGKKIYKTIDGPGSEIGRGAIDAISKRAIGGSKDIYDNQTSDYDNGKDGSLIKETAAYNAWRQTLPKNLQKETPDYDLYGAFQAGLQPEWNDEDKSYHLGSRDPKTGRILKKPGHPTFGQAIYNDMLLGYYPIYKDGEIYTENPFKYDSGKDSGIHIKKKNRGKFTAAAKRAGMGVQAYARKILNAPKGKYSSTLRKRANFAANAAKWAK